MFIAMNRFRVKRGAEETFEKVWLGRDSYLDRVPGFVEFHLLKGPEADDHTLDASHTVWQSERFFEHGPNRRSSALRMPVPAMMRPCHFIWSIRNSRASRCDKR
jgi:heme-degrading monooxygenase HmoA